MSCQNVYHTSVNGWSWFAGLYSENGVQSVPSSSLCSPKFRGPVNRNKTGGRTMSKHSGYIT